MADTIVHSVEENCGLLSLRLVGLHALCLGSA